MTKIFAPTERRPLLVELGHIGRQHAGSTGIDLRDGVTEVDDVFDVLVVGAGVTNGGPGIAVLTIGEGEDGETLPQVNTPIVASISNPPTHSELEAALGLASASSGQAWLVIDDDTGLGYRVWSTGLGFDFVPVVAPASDLATIASSRGIFSDFTAEGHAAAYDATSGKLFFTYLNAAGDACISSWDGATLVNFTLHAALSPGDSHAQPVLLVRASDRKIVVAYSAHIGAAMYVRISSSAADVSAFAAETNIAASLGTTSHTYPILIELSDGIYLFYRRTGAVSNATWCYSKSTDNGATWSAKTDLFKEPSKIGYLYPSKTSDTRIDFLASDDAIFVATGPASLFHFYMTGGLLYTTGGTEITATLPIATASMTLVSTATGVQTFDPGGPVILGTDGYPRAFWRDVEDATPNPEDIRYMWSRWDGAVWFTTEVAAAGVGAPRATGVFRDGDPYSVYYTKDVSGVAQVFKAVTPDEGVTWRHQQITDATDDQSRLAAVEDGLANLPVIWMDGYVDDSTSSDITGASWTPAPGSDGSRVVVVDGTGRAEAIIQRTSGGAWQISRDLGSTWENLSGGAALSGDDPLPDGTADPGASSEGSRSDHVHPASQLLTVDAGTVTYSDAGDDVEVTIATVWGFDGTDPYYDSAGASAGEEALLAMDPSDGGLVVVPYNP